MRVAGSNPAIMLKILNVSLLPFGRLINLQLFLLPQSLRNIDMSLDLIAPRVMAPKATVFNFNSCQTCWYEKVNATLKSIINSVATGEKSILNESHEL